MSELFEGGNHTAEASEVTDVQPEQTEGTVESTEPSVPQEEFDIIKYNKEELQIPVSERQKYLQQGYHYENKIKPEYDQLKQQTAYLDRLAKLSGYQTTDDFIQAVEAAERQREMQEAAAKMNIDPETYQQYFQPVNSELEELRSKVSEFEQKELTRQVEAEVNELRQKYSDFGEYEEKVIDLAIERGYRLEDAYKVATYEDRIAKVAQQKEQEVIQKLQQNQLSSAGSLAGGDVSHNTNISQMSKTDFQRLKESVLRGERRSL
jgi:hypothetical protein